jgi:hypothetical protein
MLRYWSILVFALGLGFTAAVSFAQTPDTKPFQLLLSEVKPGGLATDHRCTVLYSDHAFHHEVASLHHGRELDRKVYEGRLSESDWNQITAILDRKDFRDLNVPKPMAKIVMTDSHIYTISVARGAQVQNMEFLNTKSMKPYESELDPLLDWWKSFSHRSMTKSQAAPSSLCALNNEGAVFSQ